MHSVRPPGRRRWHVLLLLLRRHEHRRRGLRLAHRPVQGPLGKPLIARGAYTGPFDASKVTDITPIGYNEGTFVIKRNGVNQASGKDIVIRWASRDAGAKAVQYPYEANANTNDEWLAEDAGNGRIRLLNRHSGLSAGGAQGDQLEQRPFDGAGHQMFTVS